MFTVKDRGYLLQDGVGLASCIDRHRYSFKLLCIVPQLRIRPPKSSTCIPELSVNEQAEERRCLKEETVVLPNVQMLQEDCVSQETLIGRGMVRCMQEPADLRIYAWARSKLKRALPHPNPQANTLSSSGIHILDSSHNHLHSTYTYATSYDLPVRLSSHETQYVIQMCLVYHPWIRLPKSYPWAASRMYTIP